MKAEGFSKRSEKTCRRYRQPLKHRSAYFAYHHTRLDYPRYRAQGFAIGSRIIESASKPALKQRERAAVVDGTRCAGHRGPPGHSAVLARFLESRPLVAIGSAVCTDCGRDRNFKGDPGGLRSLTMEGLCRTTGTNSFCDGLEDPRIDDCAVV